MSLLQTHHLAKKYGSVTALDSVSLTLQAGEVVGLAGRNGAGITTLIKVLAGLLTPDQGRVEFDGRRLVANQQTVAAGMSIIHQQPELAENLTIADNIFLGQELGLKIGRWVPFPNQSRMEERAKELLIKLDLPHLSLHERAQNLAAEDQQLVAIAHALAGDNKLILIDNPSFLLSIPYQKKLLQLIREWQQKKVAVLFSSNNLDHLFAVCDRILVLRQGRLVMDVRADQTTREAIVATLVGTFESEQHTPAIWALDSYYRAREQAEMLRHNQRLLERDLQARDTVNRQLYDRLAEQVKALDQANAALQAAQRRLLTEREEERKRLAREIHDQAIQDLLSLNYQLEEVEARIVEKTAVSDDIVEVRQDVRTMVEELRRICGNLRPPTIDSLGLEGALRSFTQEWSRRTGIKLDLELEEDFGRLPEALELSIFRIVQEGLNNIWKHADASKAAVTLRPTSPRLLLISISDNGRGIDQQFNLARLGSDGHYGLLGLSERVALLGGRLRFENRPLGGLLLQVEIPHPRVVRE
ncbi:MAG: ATP-binding cassette domain-containing protein [Chloroflexota bacterium]